MKTAHAQTPRTAAILVAVMLLATLCLAGTFVCPAQADDENPGDAGIPAPQVLPTGAEKEADGGADWSRPSTAPVVAARKTNNAQLPPPQIVRRSRRAPTRSAFPAYAGTQPVARDVPATRRLSTATRSRDLVAPVANPVGSPVGTPIAPDARRIPNRAAVAPRLPAACRILSIQKTHNVEGADIENGQLFLQLDVEYEVRGQQGRDVFIGIWFARSADGRLVRSLLRRFADSADNVTIQTRWTRVTGATMRYAATLRIPYSTFPAHESGKSYQIDARVQLLRNETRGRVTLLARDNTTFRVYGQPEEEWAATRPPSDGLDRRGFAVAGETGEIMEPGIPTGFGAKDVAGETGAILTPGIQDGSGPKDTPGEVGKINDLSK